MGTNRKTARRWCIAMAIAVGACARSPALAPEKIRIGVGAIPVYALLFVAEDAGLFKEEGVEVEFVTFTAGRDALPPLRRGELDAATVYTTPILLQAMEGQPLVGFTTLHRARGLSGLVARDDSGIRSFAELRGKRIGVTPETSSEFLLDLMIAEGGLQRDEVQRVHGNPGELMQQLAQGRLHAAVLWGQQFLSARAPDGEVAYRRLTSDAYSEISFLVATPATYQERREGLSRVLRALARAERRIGERPELARAAISRRFPHLTETQVDEVLRRARFEVGLSNLAVFMLRQEGAFLQQLRGKDAPWVPGLLRPELIREVARETVTALLDPETPRVEEHVEEPR